MTEVEEKQTFAQENDDGTTIVRVIEDLIPSFPERYLCFPFLDDYNFALP